MARFNKDAAVRHPRFGRGQVVVDQGDSVVVRFEHGIEECRLYPGFSKDIL